MNTKQIAKRVVNKALNKSRVKDAYADVINGNFDALDNVPNLSALELELTDTQKLAYEIADIIDSYNFAGKINELNAEIAAAKGRAKRANWDRNVFLDVEKLIQSLVEFQDKFINKSNVLTERLEEYGDSHIDALREVRNTLNNY